MFSETFPVHGVTVSFPDGTSVAITNKGTIRITDSLILHNVLHAPSFRFNLISVCSLLQRDNCSAHFYPCDCFIQDHTRDLMIGKGLLVKNLYILAPVDTTSRTGFCGSLVDGNIWHQRLGHPSLVKMQHIPGISLPKSSLDHCRVCHMAKQKNLPFTSHNNLSDSPFDLIHLDTWGPFSVESIDGYRYFLTIVDDCTRVTWIYMMRNKSDVSSIFPTFIKHVHTQYNTSISDNAPEAFTQLIIEHVITHQFSCAYTPQQKSVVERKHQHLLNVARALLFLSNVPLVYWSDCVLTAVFLINHTPSLLLNKLYPYEVLRKKTPDYHFCVFLDVCVMHLHMLKIEQSLLQGLLLVFFLVTLYDIKAINC